MYISSKPLHFVSFSIVPRNEEFLNREINAEEVVSQFQGQNDPKHFDQLTVIY